MADPVVRKQYKESPHALYWTPPYGTELVKKII